MASVQVSVLKAAGEHLESCSLPRALISAILCFLFYKLYLHPTFISSIRRLPGPVNHLNVFKNAGHHIRGPDAQELVQWTEKWGFTLKIPCMFGQNMLYVSDPAVGLIPEK